MILDVLGWLAIADVVAAVLLAGVVYAVGRQRNTGITTAGAIGLALLLGLPAVVFYLAIWLLWQLH